MIFRHSFQQYLDIRWLGCRGSVLLCLLDGAHHVVVSLLPFVLRYSLGGTFHVFVSLGLGTLQSLLFYIECISSLVGFRADFLLLALYIRNKNQTDLTLCLAIRSSAKLLLQNLQFLSSKDETQ